MTNQNEIVIAETGEIVESIPSRVKVIEETEKFKVVQLPDGKFKRVAKYQAYSSVKLETKEDKLWLLSVVESDEETGNGLKRHVGKVIEVQDVMFRPYDKLDEETGDLTGGVITYLITPDRVAYATSSKSVYFTMNNIFELLGYPHQEDWENIRIQVGEKKGQNGMQITVKMVK